MKWIYIMALLVIVSGCTSQIECDNLTRNRVISGIEITDIYEYKEDGFDVVAYRSGSVDIHTKGVDDYLVQVYVHGLIKSETEEDAKRVFRQVLSNSTKEDLEKMVDTLFAKMHEEESWQTELDIGNRSLFLQSIRVPRTVQIIIKNN